MNSGDFLWTIPQRRALVTIVLLLIALLGYRAWRDRMYVPDPAGPGPRAGELPARLDPNRASEAELAALPNVGPKRAAAIVEYREKYASAHPGTPAFEKPADLTHVPGVGASVAQQLSPYLNFGE